MSLPILNRLSVRIVVFVVVLFSIAISIYAYVFINNEIEKEQESILSSGKTFAELSAPLFYQDYLTSSSRGFPTFEDLATERMKHNTNILKVALVAINGKIIFDSDDFGSGVPVGRAAATEDRFIANEQTRQQIQHSTISLTNITQDGEQLVEIIVPLIETGGSHLFSMQYILSYQSLQALKEEIYRQAILVFVPFLLFTGVAGIFLAYSISHPITQLISATEELTKQNFTIRVPQNSRDEIGILARAFNQAAEKLEEAREKIENYNKVLESQVSDRTTELQKKLKELEELNKLMIGRELKMTELKKELEELKQKQ